MGIIIILVIVSGGYLLFGGTDFLAPKPQTQPPRVLVKRDIHERVTIEEPSEPTTESGILDFSEVHRFSSIEEIGKIRFTMTVGKVYVAREAQETCQQYSYHGIVTSLGHTGGAVHIKNICDPEFTTESKFLVQVGGVFIIGFTPTGEGRLYMVRVLEVNPTTLKLRIEDITE